MKNSSVENVILRNLSAVDNEVIAVLKKETGYNSASKAILKGIHAYYRLIVLYKKKCSEMDQLKKDMEKIQQTPQMIDAMERMKSFINEQY